MKKIATTPLALMELIGLIEQGYHLAYEEDCGDYYTVLITNDNGNMKDDEITDRYFDFDYVADGEGLTDEERYKIAREVDRENKLTDIIARVNELDEDGSSYLNGYSATEIIEDEYLLDEILRRYERAEGWVDNSDYWYLIDDCIRDVLKTERRINE